MRFDALFAKIAATRHVVRSSFNELRQVFRSLTDDDKRAFKPSSEPSASLGVDFSRPSRGEDVADFGNLALRQFHLHQFKTTVAIARRY